MSLPIALIVDDPAPLINVYWWHLAATQGREDPVLPTGEAVARSIPVDFLSDFTDLIARWEISGKFSVLPYPAGLGSIGDGWKGCDRRDLARWLDLVRSHVAPRMDITPEILTHARALDLDRMTLLPENERDWAQHQSAATLTPYIGYALQLLNEVGLPANGVTSPWDFGIEVEEEYQRAIHTAMKAVNGRGQTWYFLHQSSDLDPQSRVVHREDDEWLVSIWSQVRDGFWSTMYEAGEDKSYIESVASYYLSEDGSSGRLTELKGAGTPMVLCTHWQSLFSNGRRTGLRALDEVCRRIHSVWGSEVQWTRCSDLAAQVAAGEFGR